MANNLMAAYAALQSAERCAASWNTQALSALVFVPASGLERHCIAASFVDNRRGLSALKVETETVQLAHPVDERDGDWERAAHAVSGSSK